MKCPKCGKKIDLKSKFCSSCGESLTKSKGVGKNEPQAQAVSNGAEENVTQIRRGKPGACFRWFLGLILLVFVLIPLFLYFYQGGSDVSTFTWIIGIIILFGVISLVIQAIIHIVRKGIRGSIPSLITLGVLVIIAIASFFIYQSYKYNDIAQRVSFLQDKVTELSAAKLLGDTFMKQGGLPVAGVTLQNINDAATSEKARLNAVSYPPELKDYVDNISAWADQIASAKDYNSWAALSDEPGKFDLMVSDSWIKGLFGNSLQELAAIKDLGLDDLKNQDRDKLRFIAAHLTSQDYFLSSIETYQTVAQNSLIPPAYAAGSAVIRTRSICYPTGGGKIICLAQAKDSVGSAKKIAQKNYMVGPAAPETTTADWNQAFAPIGDALDGLTPQGGIGLTPGEPNTTPQLPPRVQGFYDSCRSRGGQIPVSLVKTRLPTTEGGYNCQIGSCWEFMTYSGKFYAGGNTGCPEQGLTPKAPFEIPDQIKNIIDNIIPTPNPNPGPNPVVTSYDGNYSVSYNYGNCAANVPGVNLGNLGIFNDQLNVSNNVVSWGTGESAKIDSNGRAVWTMNMAGVGSVQQVFNFTQSGVSGTFTFSVSASGVAIGCNGSLSGSKL